MQVGPETYQCVDREVETRDAYIPSSMWRVHYHFGRWSGVLRAFGCYSRENGRRSDRDGMVTRHIPGSG
ncbi:hypothetical protein Gotur_027738 [Gossypium turneri]